MIVIAVLVVGAALAMIVDKLRQPGVDKRLHQTIVDPSTLGAVSRIEVARGE